MKQYVKSSSKGSKEFLLSRKNKCLVSIDEALYYLDEAMPLTDGSLRLGLKQSSEDLDNLYRQIESLFNDFYEISSSTKVLADTYYETDPARLISEEDMLSQIIGSCLNLMSDSDMTLDDACQAYLDWIEDLVKQAKDKIASGDAKSNYER